MEGQIRYLLERFLKNERLQADELRQLRNWLSSPKNQSVLKQWAQDAWLQSEETESTLEFDKLIAEIDRLSQQGKASAGFSGRRFWPIFQRVAAVLILPVIIFAAYQYFNKPSELQQMAEVIVPPGQKSELVLPDNTHIWLNSGSTLRYATNFLSQSNREVYLDGEAYFEVARLSNSHFVVRMERSAVEVLGTKFNVRAYADDEQIEASLFHGKVNFVANDGAANASSELMNPGETIEFDLKTNQINKQKSGAEELLAWKDNRLVFADDNFDAVVRKIERWYNVQVIYEPGQFVGQRLTLVLEEGESIGQLLQIMHKVMHIQYEINNKQVNIKPN